MDSRFVLTKSDSAPVEIGCKEIRAASTPALQAGPHEVRQRDVPRHPEVLIHRIYRPAACGWPGGRRRVP